MLLATLTKNLTLKGLSKYIVIALKSFFYKFSSTHLNLKFTVNLYFEV